MSMLNPNNTYALSPEALEFTQVYLSTLDLEKTAEHMQIPVAQATSYLRKKEVKRFLDNVFLDQGYTSRFKLKELLTTIIDSKLDEALETEVYSNKDLVDILKIMLDFRKQELNLTEKEVPTNQTNVQVNSYNDNLSNLIGDLVKGNK